MRDLWRRVSSTNAPRETRRVGRCLGLGAWFGVALAASAANAQGVAANPSRPAMDVGRNLLDVESADVGAAGDWSVATLVSFSHQSLRLRNHDGLSLPYSPESRTVVDGQTIVHVLGTYGVTTWLELGADLPIVVQQSGDAMAGRPDPAALEPGAGFGDARVQAKLHLVQTGIHRGFGRISVGATLDVAFPTGRDSAMQSNGGSFAPRAIVGWETIFGPRLVLNLGYTFRGNSYVLNAHVPDGVAWELGLEAPIHERARVLVTYVDDLAREATLGVAGNLRDFELQAYVAYGLDGSPFTPAYRLGGGLTYRPGLSAPADRDGDGIIDDEDHCGTDPEDFDAFEDDDGCPEADNDRDGVEDTADRCIGEPEDLDGHDDADGCPDVDNDADGTTDAFDRCPDAVEDHDGFQDQDGCPEADNDRDGLVDESDRCPDDAEDVDGVEDSDGCPDVEAVATIDTVVYFALGSAEIPVEARYPLGRVARTILGLPAHLHVWVEGYADDVGNPSGNVTLSRQRAQAVFDFLVARGVPREQIDVSAYGERNPAYANESEQDRQVNRRVEFRVAPRSVRDETSHPSAGGASSEGGRHE